MSARGLLGKCVWVVVWLLPWQMSWGDFQVAQAGVVSAVQQTGTEVTLLGVNFRDTKLGWAVGAGGVILKTVDVPC